MITCPRCHKPIDIDKHRFRITAPKVIEHLDCDKPEEGFINCTGEVNVSAAGYRHKLVKSL